MVCYGTTLTAVFEPSFPLLTLSRSPVAGGTVTGAGTFTNGTTVTVNASPAVGYAFASWRQATTVLSVAANYTFPLTTHTALTAIFVTQTNLISADAEPVEGGSVSGAGSLGNGATVTLTAIPETGFAFTNWTLGGAPAGTNNPVTFDALADYAFVANFTAVSGPVAPPQLAFGASSPGVLILQWPTNETGSVLEQNSDLGSTNWVTFAGPTTVVGTNYQATIPTQTGSGFFRLAKP
jgi:hypothetical protein